MATSTRREALTLGVGLGGLLGLAGQAVAEPGDPKGDEVRQVDPKVLASIGVVDLDAVFKGCRKALAATAEFKADVAARQTELKGQFTKITREQERLKTLTPGTEAHQNSEAAIKAMKTQFEAAREHSETEFTQREAKVINEIYQEIRQAVAIIAKRRGLALVVRGPAAKVDLTQSDPKTLLSAMERTVIYADPRTDVTEELISRLNLGA